MEHRNLGRSGLRVSVLSLGTMTFGGRGNFAKVGDTDVAGAARQIDMCPRRRRQPGRHRRRLLRGRVRGDPRRGARRGRRDRVLLATKARMPMGDGPNDAGLSRHHLIAACEASLRRLRHRPHRPLPGARVGRRRRRSRRRSSALDDLVRAGKVRYVGCSNYAGWQLMKALGDLRAARLRALRLPADPLLAAGARGRVRAGARRGSTRASGSWSGARSAGGLLSGKYRRGQDAPDGLAPA